VQKSWEYREMLLNGSHKFFTGVVVHDTIGTNFRDKQLRGSGVVRGQILGFHRLVTHSHTTIYFL